MRTVMGCLVALACFAGFGCGDDSKTETPVDSGTVADAGTDIPAPPADLGQDVPAPPEDLGQDVPAATSGVVTMAAAGITGSKGKILLGFLTTKPEGGQTGAACLPIDADPFSASGPIRELKGTGGPCELKDEPLILPNGDYTATFGVYTPGKQTPDVSATVDVTVKGDTTVTAPDFASWK